MTIALKPEPEADPSLNFFTLEGSILRPMCSQAETTPLDQAAAARAPL
jgi:hypothetical protein